MKKGKYSDETAEGENIELDAEFNPVPEQPEQVKGGEFDNALLDNIRQIASVVGVEPNGALAMLIGFADTLINYPELGSLVLQASKISDGVISEDELMKLQGMMQGESQQGNDSKEQIMALIESFLPGAGDNMQGFVESLEEGNPAFTDDTAFIKGLQEFMNAKQSVIGELELENPSQKNPETTVDNNKELEDDDNTKVKKSMVKISVTSDNQKDNKLQKDDAPIGKQSFLEFLNSKL